MAEPTTRTPTLTPAYELSDVVVRENRLQDMGQGGGEPNTRPTIRLEGAPRRSVAVATPISLTVAVGDDGFPTPRPSRRPSGAPPRVPKPNPITQAMVKPNPEIGLTVTWVHYRGRGDGDTYAGIAADQRGQGDCDGDIQPAGYLCFACICRRLGVDGCRRT